MPTVKTPSGPTVGFSPLQGRPMSTNVPAGAFDTGGAAWQQAGKTVDALGSVLDKRLQEMKKEDDANAAMDAFTKASDEARAWLRDPQSGVLTTRRGQNALGKGQIGEAAQYDNDVYTDTRGFYDDALNRYSATLANDDQRRAFKALWSRERESGLDTVSQFQAKQREEWQKGQTSAMLENSINYAADNSGDPAAVEDAIVRGKAALWANRQGRSTEEMSALEGDFVSKVHTAVIAKVAQEDYRGAKAYYDANGKALSAADQRAVQNLLEREQVVQESLDVAMRVLNEGGSESSMKAKVDAMYPANKGMRDAVWSRVRQEQMFRKQAQTEAEQNSLDATLKSIYDTKDPQARMTIVERYKGKHFAQVLSFAQTLNAPTPEQKEIDKEVRERNDLVVNAKLRAMVDAGEVRGELDLLSKAAQLGVTDIAKAKDAVDYWRTGGGKVKDSDLHTIYQELTGKKWTDDETKFAVAADFVRKSMPPEGRTPEPETLRKNMARALMKDDSYFGAKTFSQYVAAGNDPATFKPNIKSDDRDRIKQQLKAAGQKVTERNIMDMYLYSPQWMGLRKPATRPTVSTDTRERR